MIVCKTSKFVIGLPGKATFTAEDWANRYITVVYPVWGLPDVFVSDMDSKFLSALWKSLCRAARIDIRMSAAHHQSANGQRAG